MNEIAFIFPNQLCLDDFPFAKIGKIYLIEHPRYFIDYAFHKQKIILHRASMKTFYDHLKKENHSIEYIEYTDWKKFTSELPQKTIFHIIDPVDHLLKKELLTLAKEKESEIVWYESPLFLTDSAWIDKNYGSKKTFLMNSFYIKQRKRLNILMENGKPVGGRWSFDSDNREKIPTHLEVPKIPPIESSKYILEAIAYVEKNFKNNPGLSGEFNYPVNHQQAKNWFELFLKERFEYFGIYEDAILNTESVLFHSVLSPLLNTGLLSPRYVIDRAIEYAGKHSIPINSLEGFIRQIVGWREFVRLVYQVIGEEQRNDNFFDVHQRLPEAFYTGTTGIAPVDDCIDKVLRFAYTHHIERLMILGNCMLLLEINPHDVYRWYMEMYIDSYDWVMVPNIYGMSQYAHPSMTTKPYAASSNYILKMSNYKKDTWCAVWDSMFWYFLLKHEKKLLNIQRMKFMLYALHKKTKSQLKSYEEIYHKYIHSLGMKF